MANHHTTTDASVRDKNEHGQLKQQQGSTAKERACVRVCSVRVGSTRSAAGVSREGESVCSVRAPALRVGLVPTNVHVLVRKHRRELGKQPRQHTVHLPSPPTISADRCGIGRRRCSGGSASVVPGFRKAENEKTLREQNDSPRRQDEEMGRTSSELTSRQSLCTPQVSASAVGVGVSGGASSGLASSSAVACAGSVTSGTTRRPRARA